MDVPNLTLRAWQSAALEQMSSWKQGPFLLSAAPGAGKTIPSLVYARKLLDAGIVTRVHVVCPTTPLTRPWAEAAGRLGVQLAPDSMQLHPPRGFHGIAATYARVASSAKRWASQCARHRRRMPPHGRRAGLGRGIEGLRGKVALAAALRHALQVRPLRDRRRSPPASPSSSSGRSRSSSPSSTG